LLADIIHPHACLRLVQVDETRPVGLASSQQKCPTHFRRAIIRNDQNNFPETCAGTMSRNFVVLARAPQFEARREYTTYFENQGLFSGDYPHLPNQKKKRGNRCARGRLRPLRLQMGYFLQLQENPALYRIQMH
jgi:hypothetical protein